MSRTPGVLHHGDCLEVVPELARRGKFDLAYADPPFNAGTKRSARVGKGERASGEHAYDDAWSTIEDFLSMLEPRLEVLRDALSERGSLWLHLDHRTVHDAKVAADRVFGRSAFWGEVVWVPGNGGKKRSGPSVTHQTILIYARGKQPIWNGDDPALRAGGVEHFTVELVRQQAHHRVAAAHGLHQFFASQRAIMRIHVHIEMFAQRIDGLRGDHPRDVDAFLCHCRVSRLWCLLRPLAALRQTFNDSATAVGQLLVVSRGEPTHPDRTDHLACTVCEQRATWQRSQQRIAEVTDREILAAQPFEKCGGCLQHARARIGLLLRQRDAAHRRAVGTRESEQKTVRVAHGHTYWLAEALLRFSDKMADELLRTAQIEFYCCCH